MFFYGINVVYTNDLAFLYISKIELYFVASAGCKRCEKFENIRENLLAIDLVCIYSIIKFCIPQKTRKNSTTYTIVMQIADLFLKA